MAGATQPITFVAYSGTNFAPGAEHDVSGRLPDLIDPWDAPIYKAAKWKKAMATRSTWQTDALSAVTGGTFNALYVAEPDFSTYSLGRTEKDNVSELFIIPWNVTMTDQVVAKNGGIDSIPDLEAYEIEKRWKQAYISWEKKIASAQVQQVDNGSNKAQMDGLFTGIQTNLTTLTGDDTTIAEADLIDKTDAMIDAGASKELDLFAKTKVISAFTRTFIGRPNARVIVPSSESEIKNYVGSYLCPSDALVTYHLDRSLATNNGVLLLDMKHLFIRGLVAPSVFKVPLSTTPHSKGWIVAQWTIDYDNEKRHGAWKGTACPVTF